MFILPSPIDEASVLYCILGVKNSYALSSLNIGDDMFSYIKIFITSYILLYAYSLKK